MPATVVGESSVLLIKTKLGNCRVNEKFAGFHSSTRSQKITQGYLIAEGLEAPWAPLVGIGDDIGNVPVRQVIGFLDVWKDGILSWNGVVCKKDCSLKERIFFRGSFGKNLIGIFNRSVSII